MNIYGYNIRGEVTNAVRRWGNNPGNPGDIVAGQTFGYDYDPIGNRTWSKRGDYAREYAANELNQMTSRGVPGVSHLLGSADEAATVTVNGQSVTRQYAYWYKDLAVTNDAAPQYPEVVIDAAWSNILSSVTGNVFVAETPEDFGYDGDGNMTNDGRFAYAWDGDHPSPRLRMARNRLIAVETLPAVVAASGAPQVRVEYAYDYIRLRATATTARQVSRRIGKTVYSDFTTNAVYAATNQTAYLYDGWNLISETIINQQSQITNLYVWGLDLSGSLQGAGGIGGLLAMHISPLPLGEGQGEGSTVFPCYDANGNIGQLLDASDPTDILAHYEYSPFGETIVAVGDLAKANPFRFSTKYHEDESGLVYYGYRYYNPDLGRWINRDPIGEKGGVNLFGFVGNNSIYSWDKLGKSIGEQQEDVENTCGPDVTDWVNDLLSEVEETFGDARWRDKCRGCWIMRTPWAMNAFDITMLNDIGLRQGMASQHFGDNAGTGDGEQTVGFDEECYYAYAVNYLLWGKINRLCNGFAQGHFLLGCARTLVTRAKVVGAVGGLLEDRDYDWRGHMDGAAASKAFTSYGYEGNYTGITQYSLDLPLPKDSTGGIVSHSGARDWKWRHIK